jgi:hypothetical protein
VSGKESTSSGERSTTGNLSDGSPCSCIGDSSPRDETSDEESGGREDLVREGRSVEALLNEEVDALT